MTVAVVIAAVIQQVSVKFYTHWFSSLCNWYVYFRGEC